MDIRKIAIGGDYKTAMHYVVGQDVLSGTNKIHLIKEESNYILIYIINEKDEVVLWKQFNNAVPISIEFNINF